MDIKRIPSIDIFRGVAVLQMIFWQIFDFFARVDIYTQAPYYIAQFSMPINGIGVGLFTFISGVCVYFSVAKRLRVAEKRKILLHVSKRYGGYILISLFFTSFVFGFKTFYTWNEAIQGIGITAIVSAILIIFVRSTPVLLLIALSIIFFQNSLSAIGNPSGNLLLNCTFAGFFSLSNLLPVALFGVVLSKMLLEKDKNFIIKTLGIGLIILTISILMHLNGIEIKYYGRSPSYLLFFIGISFILFGLIEFFVLKIRKNIIFDILKVFGKAAIAAYLFHFLFIYKPLAVMGLESVLPEGISFILSILSVTLIYYVCILWLKREKVVDGLLKR